MPLERVLIHRNAPLPRPECNQLQVHALLVAVISPQDTDNGTSPTLPPNPKEKKMMIEKEYNQKWYCQPPHHWVKLAVAILLGLLGAVGVIALMQLMQP